MPAGSRHGGKATQFCVCLFEINLHLPLPGVMVCLKLLLSFPQALQTCDCCKMFFCFLLRF